MDNPVTVHDINELTVVTDESYTEFVTALQKEIVRSYLVAAPQVIAAAWAGELARRGRPAGGSLPGTGNRDAGPRG